MAQDFTVSYGVYAGGFRALDVAMQVQQSPARYVISMKAVPYGVIGSILPWAGEYKTQGHMADGAPIPDSHAKISRWRDDNDQDYFTYQDGVLVAHKRVSLGNGRERAENRALDPAFHKGSVDLLTAVMRMLADTDAAKDGHCAGNSVIFDGKRRFRLAFTDIGGDTLVQSKYNMAQGPARICEVEMFPLNGFGGKPKGYYKIQEEARKRGQLPRIWLASLWQGGPMLPVKMLVKSEYGAVLAHAQKADAR